MLIETRVLNEAQILVFHARTQIDALNLMILAESREDLVRQKGAIWAAGVIPFLGQELIKVMRSEQLGDAIDKAAIDVAMAAWLSESIYEGLDAETFVQSNLEFTMMPGGAVKYDRRPAILGRL